MESLSQKYQQKTDKQHVLDNPDTYTGTMTMTEIETFIHEEEEIKSKTIEIIFGTNCFLQFHWIWAPTIIQKF